jgi:uncharacterized protein YndB with AHSA1/START domain
MGIMTTHGGTGPDGLPELRLSRTLNCRPADLWEMVTQPRALGEWFGTTSLSDDHFGQFEVTSGPMAGTTGMVLACEPPHTYQVTWNDPPSSKLLVEVVETTHGSELILTHRGARTRESRWTEPLDRLATYAERGVQPSP